MAQIEYKRLDSWAELFSEELPIYNRLKIEGKLRPMEGLKATGIMIEHALNRLGKEGWKLAYVHRVQDRNSNTGFGIFLMRETTKSPDIPKIEDLVGPTPGNTEAKLPLTP